MNNFEEKINKYLMISPFLGHFIQKIKMSLFNQGNHLTLFCNGSITVYYLLALAVSVLEEKSFSVSIGLRLKRKNNCSM